VLDLACGTGRHSIPLSVEGYGMVGVDASPKLLRIAKSRCRGIDVVLGDMRLLPFKAEVFGAVVSVDTSLGYLPTVADDSKSVAEAHRVLCRGGVFVVDVFNGEELRTKYRGETKVTKWLEYPSFWLQQQRSISADGERLHDLWTIQPKSGGEAVSFEHSVRIYGKEELQGLLENAGFTVECVFGDYERQGFSPETTRLILVANAK
jgi:ubiquinone/menaquinone biosynthesis C-methylase UbiE